MSTENTSTQKVKKSIFRWGAIIPFTVICFLTGLYFHFFFDGHLRRAIEWTGYKALGAEVNIESLDTSFLDANIHIQGIELTDSEKPTHDSIKIGSIKFGMLWDALLRVKFVINEASIEHIEFGSLRKNPGKVAPPPPVSNEPGMLSVASEQLKGEAQKELEARYQDNVFGDIIAMLSSGDTKAPIEKLQNSLPSKAMIEKFQKDLNEKQKSWDARFKTLPQGKEIQALGDRLNKIQYKDFKNPQEFTAAVQQLQALVQEADGKYKQIQSISDDFNKDLKTLKSQYEDIEKQVKIDTKNLEQHFKIPQLDAKALTLAVFNRYLAPYKAKFFKYKSLAEKYLPPKFLAKHKSEDKDNEVPMQAHPREKGISYEFGRPHSYPLFWIKKSVISSQAGSSANAGNIKGEILDISSNQILVGKPTVASIDGDFPGMGISGIQLRLTFDNRPTPSLVSYKFKVDNYRLEEKELVTSSDVTIAFKSAHGKMNLEGSLLGLKNIKLGFENQFSKIDYSVSAKNEIAQQILNSVFKGISVVNLTANAQGELPNIPLSIESNLGPDLQKGFQKEIQAKVTEAQKQIQAYVDNEIGKQKAQVDEQLNKLKSLFDSEVKKSQSQLDDQKKQAENKVNAAKKDAENQGRKKLETEGKKALEDLKKQFGF